MHYFKRYHLLWAAAIAVALVVPTTGSSTELKVHGLTMIPWAAKIEEDRYRSPRDYDATIKWFHKRFGYSSKWIVKYRQVNLPGIKYVHFENRHPKAKWSGFNIYQKGARGEVRIFVLKKIKEDTKPDEKKKK